MKVYRVLGHTIAFCVVLQATWIALANFTLIHGVDGGDVIDKSYEGNYANGLHALFGMLLIPLLAIVLMITSFFVKVPGGIRWAGFVLLAVVVQIALAFTAFSVPVVGALHGINAFVVLGLAEYSARRAGGPGPSEVPADAAASA
jgi:hypothetical protein